MSEKHPWLFALGVALLIGFVTFWLTTGLILIGNPVNPYLTWYILWGGSGLVLVWKLKRAEVRERAVVYATQPENPDTKEAP